MGNRLTAAAETYFTELARVQRSGGATSERSMYGPLSNLLDAVGATLNPKVFCVPELADQGAGHPDFGLYTAKQVHRRSVRDGHQAPERGVVEVKPIGDDAWVTAESDQVTRYWDRYRLVLVTNLRDFVLVGVDDTGLARRLETFRLASSSAKFLSSLDKPRAFARREGAGLGEYLARVLSHRSTLVEPRDVAWLLASYARDGLARIEAADDVGPLEILRSALEDALGVRFEGEKGLRFFHSTLVQTLFYGIFSAWVLWSREIRTERGPFRWREAAWHLRAPVLASLFQQLSHPPRLEPLNLVEVLDWAAAALDRVDQAAFLSRFDEGEAVGYFYEPFLEAFDPALRKQLGVWYTPTEVVRYMVARVDRALKDDLRIPTGLAADNVYVLDPCCGTGAFLSEVLRRIAANLDDQGIGALVGARVKEAATTRVFGFEIMPAPFVVAHLQVGLTMQSLDAPFDDASNERAGVFLTNALTGWEPRTTKPLPFPELEEERDRADRVKRDTPILVIVGNPPYDGFGGVAIEEERELSDAYRTSTRVRKPTGRGLNDPYIRFFRMAERRIAEKTGQGVICFISNYGWLEGPSTRGMRERYLDAFDEIRVDCLNGDKRRTGKVAPDGSPDPSVFSTEGDPVGIQVGTAIATLVRREDHVPATTVGFRHLWGRGKRTELTATAEASPEQIYQQIEPSLGLDLPFEPVAVSADWLDCPALTELLPVRYHGVLTNRDAFLVDIDIERLRARVADYFDAKLSHGEVERRHPSALKSTAGFDARAGRAELLERGGPVENGFIRISYRPFDNRWLYWEGQTKLLDRKRAEYKPHVFEGNLWLSAAQQVRQGATEPQTAYTQLMGSHHLIERGANMFPAWLRNDGIDHQDDVRPVANLSGAAGRYLDQIGLGVEDLFYHILATLHAPEYLSANSGALRVTWPRIPLPAWPDGESDAAATLILESATRGRALAALLDPDSMVPGVTEAPIRPELAPIAVPATVTDRNMTQGDRMVTEGWGHFGQGSTVMPGQGHVDSRGFSVEENAAMGAACTRALGDATLDIYLNANALWRNVPAAVWNYTLGGYQVLKKWLSYRENKILGRALTSDEVWYFTETARRIAAILLANYRL